MIDVENYNRSFPRYPKTIFDKGWVYGVWYCGTAWKKASLYGQYPPGFLKRTLALFPRAGRILHCPSGTVDGPGITVDIQHNGIIRPQIVADASALPFGDNLFDLILSDPPYSDEDSKKYNQMPFSLPRAMKEFFRILQPGGYLAMLHIFYPAYNRRQFSLQSLIMVITGFQRRARVLSIFQKNLNHHLPFQDGS